MDEEDNDALRPRAGDPRRCRDGGRNLGELGAADPAGDGDSGLAAVRYPTHDWDYPLASRRRCVRCGLPETEAIARGESQYNTWCDGIR